MASLVASETAQKLLSKEAILSAAKQSQRCVVVPVRLRRAIKTYLRELEEPHMRRKVLRLSESFSDIKDANLQMAAAATKELVEDPMKSMEQSQRWKIKSSYGDVGLKYTEDHTVAYVASRMPAVFSACHRVLKEVKRRLPDFRPVSILDFGGGTGSAMWALREVWPRSIERINLIEPSKSMQRAGQSLIQDLKDPPLIKSYDSILALSKKINKSEREHDLVIASYVLGEIPSVNDRITIVRQLWDLTKDVLVLVEPGTPHGFNIISQMRSHILWKEKRKCRKSASNEASKDIALYVKNGAFVVAPCPHDGACPLEKTGKYCHFVQRLERTSTQRVYKRSKGGDPLRGFEDEKFCYVVLKRGQRPQEPWPLDGLRFETLKEQHARRNPEDLEIDYEDQFNVEEEEVRFKDDPAKYNSDSDSDSLEREAINGHDEGEDEEEEEAVLSADLGSGWGRIVFSPVRRGKLVEMNVCRSTKRDGSEGSFQRIVVTKSKNPVLHKQAKRSLWGDLWPC